jgi:hypothetical protein
MKRLFSLAAILMLFVVGTAHAQCPGTHIITAGTRFDRPEARFTKLDAISLSTPTTSLRSFTLTDKPGDASVRQWVVTLEDVERLRALRDENGTNLLRLRWKGETGDPCDVRIAFGPGAVTEPPSIPDTQQAAPGADLESCRKTGEEWKTTLDQQIPDGRYSIVIFTEDNQVCYTNPDIDRQSEGNPIYVGIFTSQNISWASPRFNPCALQSSTPRFNAPASGTTVFNLLSGRQSDERTVLPPTPPSPQRCFNENVEISVDGKPISGATKTIRYNLRQHPRYHFTLQLGAYDAEQVQHSFGTRNVVGKNQIYDKGPSGQGLQYYASVVIYGAPHYLLRLRDRRQPLYPGRDLVHDQSWLDRTSLILGAGLETPAKHLVAGIGWEVINGVSVTYTYNRRKFSTLADGVKVGDEFTGDAATIPVQDVWDSEWALGLSLDLGYALRFLQR